MAKHHAGRQRLEPVEFWVQDGIVGDFSPLARARSKTICLEHCTKPFLQLLISITATVEYVCLISFPITLPIHIKSCSCYKNKIHCTNIAKNALKVYRFRSKNYQLSYKRQENEKKNPLPP